MGGKITIDSATLMNKGLEMIEAHHLFGVALRRDRRRRAPAVDRPLARSISTTAPSLAHLGYPDMRVPISYALHFPDRADVPVRGARPRGCRRAHASSRPTRALPLPAARARGRRGRGHGALRAQRGQRGRRRAFLDGGSPFIGIAAGDRADARGASRRAGRTLRGSLRRPTRRPASAPREPRRASAARRRELVPRVRRLRGC